MSARTKPAAMLLALLAAGCSGMPGQKPFPGYSKAPDRQQGDAQQPAAIPEPASAAASEPSTSAGLLARKVEATQSTLDRAVETTRSRLTALKQQIVRDKRALAERGGREANREQYAALEQAEAEVGLALARMRVSTSRRAATVPEQASTIRDLGGLITSVSGVVDTIGDGGSVGAPAILAAEATPAGTPGSVQPAQPPGSVPATAPSVQANAASPVGPSAPLAPSPIEAVAATQAGGQSSAPPGPVAGTENGILQQRAKPSRPLPVATPPAGQPAPAAPSPVEAGHAPQAGPPAAPQAGPGAEAANLRLRAKPSRPLPVVAPPPAPAGPPAGNGQQPSPSTTSTSSLAPGSAEAGEVRVN